MQRDPAMRERKRSRRSVQSMLMPLLPSLLRRCSNTSRGAAPAARHCLLQRQKKSVEARKLFNLADYSGYYLTDYLTDYLDAASTGAPDCCSNSFSFFCRNGRLATSAQFA